MSDSARHSLDSSADPRFVVTGASGGIGQAMVKALLAAYPQARIQATFFNTDIPFDDSRVGWSRLDLRSASDIEIWCGDIKRVDWIINCAGYLHDEKRGPEKTIRSLDPEHTLESVRINTLPTLVLAKHLGPALKDSSSPLIAGLSARVGSIDDNRLGGWYSYRISKAALNMAIKTLSIEWRHSHPRGCVVALHPGTNDTRLSKPFQSRVASQDLFEPADTATSFVELLSGLGPADSGSFLAWDGSPIPW